MRKHLYNKLHSVPIKLREYWYKLIKNPSQVLIVSKGRVGAVDTKGKDSAPDLPS